ncbi:hypothetical protein V8J88_06030 [Massilia sp. W12]|uniref:hypothetical protein n=1 Tax=Massilia sp. W12 TaxID=3126507 RepID=UPI0030CBE4D2
MTVIAYHTGTRMVKASEDMDVYYSMQDLKLRCNASITWHNGAAGLERLDTPGGELYVVGHGHAGGRIGAHGHPSVGARTLLRQLTEEGLPVNPANLITIYLHACATGASVRTNYCLWRKDPYAERFAAALVDAGFNNFHVVGYAGFLNSSGQMCMSYHVQNASKREFSGLEHRQGHNTDKEIVFLVKDGDYSKISGANWQQFYNKRRKNSLLLDIRKV